eukprot:TRINITY_DN3316_c0_g1_i1.p1 TRINITY_DN3316_c0_g1~~TRINITY_DN3316_c0_g1_i1.p1  ORF type:complete len:540 (+),score=98.27 TRINITY_DN3316_c0_g1_i1:182-1801(+)
MSVAHRDVAGVLRKHNYAELKKIGEGSFGKAILVQSGDGAKLVCKMVDVSAASAKETTDAVKEGKLLAAFKHPYIVRYRESFIDSGWLCILMDYCEGGDLSQQIEQAKRRRQPLPEEQVLRWMTQALLALKYIHEKHVLHRDLKSSNFFLSKAGNLKMGDFGIAKVLSCTAACARTQIGTPYYLSPEVCQEKPYTWPSDIWAMGCIFYELCERKVPFDASNISGLVQKICRGPTPIIGSGYSDFVKSLGSEMLNRNATLRPSAETILQRPRIQEVVKALLDQAQAAQEERQPGGSSGADTGDDRSHGAHGGHHQAPAPVSGPYSDASGSYRRGDLVEYHSSTHKDWLPATVVNVDVDGRIIIDLKPNTWLTREAQANSVRPRRRPSRDGMAPQAHGIMHAGGVGGGCGYGTPSRQRSPQRSPSSDSLLAARERASTPGRGNPAAPWLGGGPGSRAGSRAGTPSGRRGSRDPSPAGLGRPGAPGGALVAGGSRAASPLLERERGRHSVDQVRPPGMPRVPGSPLRPCRAANAAGMAIAGI